MTNKKSRKMYILKDFYEINIILSNLQTVAFIFPKLESAQ